MIIFHEGLPRAGKSYEAMVHQALPALERGRKVFAYVEGINHDKIAEVLQETPETIRQLLIPLTREQVPEIYNHVENDSLVIIDELQNFFPAGRQKLSDDMTQFVTEHGHRGLDILAMGQDLRDCHNLWKRRVAQKVTFVKLDAVGMENRYTWTIYKATTGEKFQKIRSGQRKYDKKYFGIYASHTDDTENTANFKDDRANIFKTPFFKYGLPAALVVAIVAVNHLVGFFQPDPEPLAQPSEVQTRQERPQQPKVADTVPVQAPSKAPTGKPEKPEPIDYLDKIASETRFRLAGIVQGENGKLLGRVEALDSTLRLKERFTLSDIEALGWEVEHYEYGLLISKTDKGRTVKHVVRPWPIDPFGRVSQAQQQRL